MTRVAGELPGTGFDPHDKVEILDARGELMSKLRAPDGRWLIAPVSDIAIPADLPTTPNFAAVIDTGICDDHPTLVGRVVEHVDLTGEGATDLNGHGTAVAAILAVTSPYTQIISAKAMDAAGSASIELLVHALLVAAEKLEGRGRLINVSAGRRTPDCNFDCPLCRTVLDLRRRDFIVVAAAGNSPGSTYCPAKAGISVATLDEWSADGMIHDAPPGWAPLAR